MDSKATYRYPPPEFYVAYYRYFLTNDEFLISDQILVVVSTVDLPLNVMLADAFISFDSTLIGAVLAAWWPLYL